jgi:hypothetical protein
MWEALEQMSWVKTFSTTGWMYASVSVIHYLTMFWFIGAMAGGMAFGSTLSYLVGVAGQSSALP